MDPLLSRLQAALTGRYTVEHELGRGGMAVVYLGHDLRLERRVAIKVFEREGASGEGTERFLREIRVAAQLQHPNILPVHESGEAEGLVYYMMPYVAGQSLRERLEREGPLPIAEAVRIAREVALALDHAHGAGIVHRDIKPDNVLLSGGVAVVADFGIARALEEAGSGKLTGTGMAVGTPNYMSPEQATAQPHVDGRADIYALGCVLYEMLAGAPPFSGPTAQAVMARHTADAVPPLSTVREVPAALEAAVVKALAKVPADRFATAGELATALQAATQAHATAGPGPTSTRRRARRWIVAGLTTTALVAVAAWRLAARDRLAGEEGTEAVRSIAVLPLRNSGDSADDYYAEGIAEQIGIALVRVPGVTVHSWAAVLDAVKSSRNPRVLGPRLKVDYVLDGSLQRAGVRTRVSVQLVRVRDGSVVWSPGPFEGHGTEIFPIQDSISTGVARELTLRLSPEAQLAVVHRTTNDPEVYNEYLLGRHFQWKLSISALDQAIEHYQRAIARDRAFAAAWQGLAEASALRDERGPGRQGLPATALTDTVLALDSTNGAAHAYRAEQQWGRWDFAGAERSYALAMKYNPGIAETFVLYAQFLNVTGRHREALDASRHAERLNPTSAFVVANLALRYQFVRGYDSAEAAARRAISLDAGNWVAHSALGFALIGKGAGQAGLAAMLEAQRLLGGAPQLTEFVGWARAHGGQREEALRYADRWPGPTRDWVLAGLGDTSGTLHYLDESIRRHDAGSMFFLRDPLIAGAIANVPRYRAFLREAEYRP